jgi:hypothetical protein
MTKHLYNAAALLFITASQQCHAMEAQNIIPANILATITAIKKPASVVCLLDSVAVLGKDGCGLYDFSGKEIIKLQDYTIDTDLQRMSAHPNKKILAVRRGNYVKVYDTTYNTTKKKIYTLNRADWSGKPIFNPIDDTILIGDQHQNIRSFNYKNNSDNHIPETSIPHHGKMLAFHPTKQEFLFTSGHSHGINIFQIGKNPDIKETNAANFIYSCQYSPDGSLIAADAKNKSFIFDPELNSENILSISSNGVPTGGMAFHPTSFILATPLLLMSANPKNSVYHICYWHTKTLQRITTTALDKFCGVYYSQHDNIDFSCDGKNIVIVLQDKCFVIEVPFEVLSGDPYELGTKNRCIFALWAMQHYLHEGGMLPHDVTQLLTYTFLKSSKF